MAYGPSTRAFVGNAAARQVSKVELARPGERGWNGLSEACRLEIVEKALRAANDRIDAYPLAL